jgi:large repetitive protein
VIGNQTGCPSQPSAAVVVNVNPAPVAPIITPSGSTTICEGEELFLFTSGSGTNTWNTGYVGAVLAISTSGNYWVSVSNVYGCSSSSAVVPVVVNTLPTVTVDPFGAMCKYAAPFTMSNGLPAGGNYVGNSIINNIFDPSMAQVGPSIVTYTYTDLNGCANDAQTTIEVNDCAGIDEKEVSYFSLFPNPSIGMFQVTSKGTPIEKIIIYDVQGKMIFNESYSATFDLNFDLSDYSNGVYYIEINGENEIHDRMPLIINH